MLKDEMPLVHGILITVLFGLIVEYRRASADRYDYYYYYYSSSESQNPMEK